MPSILIEPSGQFERGFLNVDELGGGYLEAQEPMSSFIVSFSTRDYRGVHLDRHERLRQRNTLLDSWAAKSI